MKSRPQRAAPIDRALALRVRDLVATDQRTRHVSCFLVIDVIVRAGSGWPDRDDRKRGFVRVGFVKRAMVNVGIGKKEAEGGS